MSPTVKRILYATDLSPNSAYAFRFAADAARRHDARIDILHVHRDLPPGAEAMLHAHLNDEQWKALKTHRENYLRARIEHRLEALRDAKLVEDPGFADRIERIDVEEGNPSDVIVEKAEALHCDMIVIGSQGRAFLGFSQLDSTSRRVLSQSRKPTFVIPLPAGETEVTFHDEV